MRHKVIRVQGRIFIVYLFVCLNILLGAYIAYSAKKSKLWSLCGERVRAEAENGLEGSGHGPAERWWWLTCGVATGMERSEWISDVL